MSNQINNAAKVEDTPVRSTSSVLTLLGGIVLVPIIILFAMFCLRGSSSTGAGSAIADVVDKDKIQAVYMTSDEVFFGRIREGNGVVFELRDAFFLRRSSESSSSKAEESSLDLVSVAQDVSGDGTLIVNASEVSRVQNLDEDAEIAKQIEKATK